MCKEPLQLVPVEKWPELQAVFLSDWPRSIPGYNALQTQARWKDEGLDYDFQVYSLYGDLTNGFVAINNKPNYYELIIQYPKDNTDILEEALKTTAVIDWVTPYRIIFAFTADHVIAALQKVIKDKNIVLDLLPSVAFILKKGSPLFEDISLPPGFTFNLLSSEHVDIVDSNWPHRYPLSTWYFQLLIDAKCGYGIFKNGALASWIFTSECGHFTHLFTLDEYRKQGLAEMLLKLVSNEVLKKNRQVFMFSVKTNESALRLYSKLGFKRVGSVVWGYGVKKS